MTERVDFEARLEARLRARAGIAARPFDAAAIARQAGGSAGGSTSLLTGWQSLPRTLRWSVLAVALAASMLGALVIGSWLLERTPPVTVSNGWVAFAVKGFERVSDSDIWIGRSGSVDKPLIGFVGDNVVQSCPAFSPDGTMIAYARRPLERANGGFDTTDPQWVGDRAGDVVVVGFDSSTGQVDEGRVPVPALGAGCPHWSPDGRSIAFDIGGRIWVVGLDGTSNAIFSSPATGERDMFDWSPDGTEIVVAASNRLTVVPLNGGEPRVMRVEEWDVRLYHPTWSPDGTRIAVEAVRHVPLGDGVRLESLPVRIIKVESSAGPDVLSDVDVDFPAWSPDGQHLAYARATPEGLREIVVTAFDGSDPRVLVIETKAIRGLTWAPDGKQVLYIADMAGGALVTVSTSGDSTPTPLTAPHMFYNASRDDISWQPVFGPMPGP